MFYVHLYVKFDLNTKVSVLYCSGLIRYSGDGGFGTTYVAEKGRTLPKYYVNTIQLLVTSYLIQCSMYVCMLVYVMCELCFAININININKYVPSRY